MSSWSVVLKPLHHPRKALLAVFIAWKSLILLIAACSPGYGYDTSTVLAFPSDLTAGHSHASKLLRNLAVKLTRWDAIYFTKIASRGYLYEQEWAFGWGFTRLIHFFAQDLKNTNFPAFDYLESFVGVSLAHACHGLSVLALYALTREVFPEDGDQKLAFITASLHIFSPAGIFLSAPYGESTFALLSFSAYLLFVRSFKMRGHATIWHDLLIPISGLFFGAATTVRSNGLFNGLLFLEEAIRITYSLRHGVSLAIGRRLVATVIGGACIALGFLLPQLIAFQEICVPSLISDNEPSRIWCKRAIPSIYTFVQDYYWNVGFLRYWTVSNLPLFALATPMLAILVISSIWAMQPNIRRRKGRRVAGPEKVSPTLANESTNETRRLLRSLAIPQFLLAVLALTSYHVQIITRISSGYCVWYFWLAALLTKKSNYLNANNNRSPKPPVAAELGIFGPAEIIRYMVLYAAVQAGLYSSFLPPA